MIIMRIFNLYHSSSTSASASKYYIFFFIKTTTNKQKQLEEMNFHTSTPIKKCIKIPYGTYQKNNKQTLQVYYLKHELIAYSRDSRAPDAKTNLWRKALMLKNGSIENFNLLRRMSIP